MSTKIFCGMESQCRFINGRACGHLASTVTEYVLEPDDHPAVADGRAEATGKADLVIEE